MGILEKERIGIEYMYAFVSKADEEALVILRVEDPERAIEALKGNNISVLPSSSVYKL